MAQSRIISSKEELDNFIQQSPLVVKKPSFEGTEQLQFPASSFFGVGLCNSESLTQGLPIDTLGMILTAEKVSDNKTILIADSHAKTNGLDKSLVDETAQSHKQILQNVCRNLDLPNWNVLLASEIDKSESYKKILDSIPEGNEYLKRELADIVHFGKNGCNLKIGWAMNQDPSLNPKDRSEIFFDKQFTQIFPEIGMSFLYSEPGRTFDPKKMRAPPYFCGDAKTRILLSDSEDVAKKIADARQNFGENAVGAYLNFLKGIVRSYNSLVDDKCIDKKIPIEARLQQIIEKCIRGDYTQLNSESRRN